MRSKALKDEKSKKSWLDYIKVDGVLWRICEYTVFPLQNNYYMIKERVSRSIAFARIGWLSYDFDAHTIWELLEFKLKRVHPVLLDGHAIQDD